jgi:hypothetical protein
MTPQESLEYLKGPAVDAYPLGVIVDRGAPAAPAHDPGCPAPARDLETDSRGRRRRTRHRESASAATPEPTAAELPNLHQAGLERAV